MRTQIKIVLKFHTAAQYKRQYSTVGNCLLRPKSHGTLNEITSITPHIVFSSTPDANHIIASNSYDVVVVVAGSNFIDDNVVSV